LPNYKINGGYSGENLLSQLGYYQLWDLNDITPSIFYNNTEYIHARANRRSEKFSFLYRKMNHFHFNKTTLAPLYDVGTNMDNFFNYNRERATARAAKGANSFEYCEGSSTALRALLAPESCEELGFPFVADNGASNNSDYKVCVRIAVTATPITKTNEQCCIGTECPAEIPSCSQYLDQSGLETLVYSNAVYAISGGVIAEITSISEEQGTLRAKDLCNQYGDICMGISKDAAEDLYYLHSYEASMTVGSTNGAEMKYPNFFLDQQSATLEGIAKSADSLLSCFSECRNRKHCLDFSFNVTSRACTIQSNLNAPRHGAGQDTSVYRLRTSTSETGDNSKSQFCFNCARGKTSSDAYQGSTGACISCEQGSISSSSEELFVAELISGEQGVENCAACPQGMFMDKVTESCRACGRHFACPHKGAVFETGVMQCTKHEYSTSSLLDFEGEDVSSTASLRCQSCSAGKYNSDMSTFYCQKCPKGFTSKPGERCMPCRRGSYALISGSDECIESDRNSFVPWPASTLSDKRSCSNDECGPDFNNNPQQRICNPTQDAQCSRCTNYEPGKRTYEGASGSCVTEACLPGFYSPTGCLGEDCCIRCSSTCTAGYHSTGCGGPNDQGGSVENTGCSPCPPNEFTQYSARDAPCKNFDDTTNQDSAYGGSATSKCTACSDEPHVIDEESKLKDHYCAVGSGSVFGEGFTSTEGATICCSAAAYKCTPCRSTPDTGNEGYYTITHDRLYEFGRKNERRWTTNGLSGQKGCTHFRTEWGNEAEKEYNRIYALKVAAAAAAATRSEEAKKKKASEEASKSCGNSRRRSEFSGSSCGT